MGAHREWLGRKTERVMLCVGLQGAQIDVVSRIVFSLWVTATGQVMVTRLSCVLQEPERVALSWEMIGHCAQEITAQKIAAQKIAAQKGLLMLFLYFSVEAFGGSHIFCVQFSAQLSLFF